MAHPVDTGNMHMKMQIELRMLYDCTEFLCIYLLGLCFWYVMVQVHTVPTVPSICYNEFQFFQNCPLKLKFDSIAPGRLRYGLLRARTAGGMSS